MSIQISVIIPMYNAEKSIQKNIEAIINQNNVKCNYEVLLINDGSKDRTDEICKKYVQNHENIKYFYQENRGVSAARNKGIEEACGKYICFIDSDDYVSSDYMNTIFETVNNCDLCIYNNYIVNSKGKIKIEKEWLQEQKISRDVAFSMCCDNKINAPWDKVYSRRKIMDNNIRFKEKIKMGEDLIFNMEYIMLCDKIMIYDRSIYYHTTNNDGLCLSGINEKRYNEICIIYDYMKNMINCFNNKEDNFGRINSTFLSNITNLVGKLYKNNYSKKQITQILNENKNYSEIISYKFTNAKSRIKQQLLIKEKYNICSILFKK